MNTWGWVAAWWLLWASTVLLGMAFRSESRRADEAWALLSCTCGAHPVRAYVDLCADRDGWHHSTRHPCRPLHEEV